MEKTNTENQKQIMTHMKAAIFDMDGTLLDSIPMWETAGLNYLKTLGITAEPDFWAQTREMDMNKCAEYIQQHYSVEGSVSEIKAGIVSKVIYKGYKETIALKEGVKILLANLKTANIPTILATATDRVCIEPCFERLAVRSYFKQLFTCSEVGKTKDEPDIFLQAAQAAAVTVENAVVFEDSLYAVKTAKKAGFKVCGVYDHSADINGDWEDIKNTADCWCFSVHELNQFFI